jgi:hypothetical protein
MLLTTRLAGRTIALRFSTRAAAAMPFCRFYLKEFIAPEPVRADIGIRIDVLDRPNGDFPFGSLLRETLFEGLVPAEPVSDWLGKRPEMGADFPIGEATVCALCLEGLLLFDPKSSAGQILLLNPGPGCYRPLHRLLWMYFAQVLGEQEICFVHSAAVFRKRKGYLFLGDSGAGKSTLAKKINGGIVLSDDSPIFFREDGEYRVCSSPFHQLDLLGGLGENAIDVAAKVEGFYFLVKDSQLYRKTVARRHAFAIILQKYIHFFPYLSAGARAGLFDLFFEATRRIPSYDLHFALNQDIWEVIDAV